MLSPGKTIRPCLTGWRTRCIVNGSTHVRRCYLLHCEVYYHCRVLICWFPVQGKAGVSCHTGCIKRVAIDVWFVGSQLTCAVRCLSIPLGRRCLIFHFSRAWKVVSFESGSLVLVNLPCFFRPLKPLLARVGAVFDWPLCDVQPCCSE